MPTAGQWRGGIGCWRGWRRGAGICYKLRHYLAFSSSAENAAQAYRTMASVSGNIDSAPEKLPEKLRVG
ncbi:MAG TPA: hypothetical protein VFZ07_04110, partial [Dongiaceae bacterium]